MARIFSGILFLLLIQGVSFAQVSEIDIKLSGNYYWGSGYGDNREAAINNAKKDLIEKIIVRVESDATLSENASDDSFSTSYQSNTSTSSRLEFRGLDYLPPKEKPNGSWEVIAYVSKTDFENSMALEGSRLLSALDQALADEQAGNLASAIPMVLDIFASTYFYPTPFYTDSSRHGSTTELRAFLSAKINSWLNSSDIIQTKIRSFSTSRNIELYIDLSLSHLDHPLENVYLRIKKTGYAQEIVRKGSISIFTDMAPESLKKEYVFEMGYVIPENLDEDKINILEQTLPTREVSIEVDFSEVISINFTAERQDDDTFKFIPEVQNLNVYSLEWIFDGANSTTDTSPEHTFSSLSDTPLIELRVNESEYLMVRKRINSEGKLVRAEKKPANPSQNETATVTNDTAQEAVYKIPFRHSSYVNNAIRLPKYDQLNDYLQRLSNQGVIDYGNSRMMPDPDKAYVVIVNPETKMAVTIMSPVLNGKRFNLRTNAHIDKANLRDEFKGLGSLWFQFK